MDINSVDKVLKKINRLYELVKELGEASSTEKDLLKAYVVDLYDAVITEDPALIVDLEREEMLKKIKKQRKLEKKLKKQKEKTKFREPEEEIEEPETVAVAKKVKVTPPVAEAKKAEPKSAIPAGIMELFEIDSGNEISDKLSQSPIADLTKSMSINEKIFTINELFGGNNAELDNMLVALNGLSNFDEAKSVLMKSVATKYNWSDASKSKKAKNFIKLVQRRYN